MISSFFLCQHTQYKKGDLYLHDWIYNQILQTYKKSVALFTKKSRKFNLNFFHETTRK